VPVSATTIGRSWCCSREILTASALLRAWSAIRTS
jgi:hypothetical protein